MTRLERRARNEIVFRAVNEKLRDLNASFEALTGDASGFLCECDDLRCAEQLSVPMEVYERVRSDPALFVVKPGHEERFEEVVERTDAYLVVRKPQLEELSAG